jgi:hypothetical protein
MGTRRTRGVAQLVRIAACAMALFCGAGCGAAAMVAVSLAGGAATASGEPQRLYGTQGQDFDEGRVTLIRSGVHVPADIVNIMGYPQSKLFTNTGEEWSYRYYVPPTVLRSGLEKILTVRFRDGKVDDVRYTMSAL